MSHKNLYCDLCGEEATVFALQPPQKAKACAEHSSVLTLKHSSVFAIAAFDFIERPEDYAEYVGRRDVVHKCQELLIALREGCESSRCAAHSRLQTAKEALQAVVERSIQELQTEVEQRYQQVKEELNSLGADLEKFGSDKRSAWTPCLEALSLSRPAGAVFRVCVGDCSLEIVKTVLGSMVLLPSEEGIPLLDAGEKLLAKAKTKPADLAEEMYAYALDLGCPAPSFDYKSTASQYRRKAAKELLLSLPWTATEPQVREVGELYLQRGRLAREEAHYGKSLKLLEKGWSLLQQWGVESAEMSLQLGIVWAHFGRKEEAVSMLRQGLQVSSSHLSLQLSRGLVEVYHQRREWKEAVEVGELALASVDSQCEACELLQLLYFLTLSHYQLGNKSRGYALLTDWTSGERTAHWTSRVESVESQCVLQCLYAEKKYREDYKEEAAELYEAALAAQFSYLTVFSRFMLGVIYTALNRQNQALDWYLQAVSLCSAPFPHTLCHATCLVHLAALYNTMKNAVAEEEHLLQAVSICSAHFPLTLEYAIYLGNLAFLYYTTGNVVASEELYLQAVAFYPVYFPLDFNYAICLGNLGLLYRSMNNHVAAETHYLRAVSLWSAYFPLNQGYANCLNNLAALYRSMKNVEASEELFLQAIALCSAHFPHSLEYADSLYNLAILYESVEKVRAAEELYLQAVSLYSARFPRDLHYADCLHHLALLYESMNSERAEEFYLKAIALYSVDFPHDHTYAHALYRHGNLLKSRGLKAEAIAAIEKSLQVFIHNKSQENIAACKSELRQLSY